MGLVSGTEGESQCVDGMVPELPGKSLIRHGDTAYMKDERRKERIDFRIRKDKNQRSYPSREERNKLRRNGSIKRVCR
jgi:hypothetical protein